MSKLNLKKVSLFFALTASMIAISYNNALAKGASSPDGLWQAEYTPSSSMARPSSAVEIANDNSKLDYATYSLSSTQLTDALSEAPLLETRSTGQSGVRIWLPSQNQEFIQIEVYENPIMEPLLANKYPMIKSYRGFGLENPNIEFALSLGSRGFQAMTRHKGNTIYIDPNRSHTNDTQARPSGETRSYRLIDEIGPRDFNCGFEHDGEHGFHLHPSSVGQRAASARQNGGTLRTYKLAVATVGEYSAAVSSGAANTTDTLSAINAAVTRINEIYRQDLAIEFSLIANNDAIIFLNSASDGFNNDAGDDIDLVTTAINAKLEERSPGSPEDYDIGHLFTVNGGGLARLQSVCDDTHKGAGVTGISAALLQSDAFYVDYVAHEIGHQFGATHTYNGTTGFCGTNRTSSSAFEPGSGSTIMGYASLCGEENIQNSSDPYFHAGSIEQMLSFIEDSNPNGGSSCLDASDITSPTTDNPPNVNAGIDYYIPAGTPFLLTASGSDSDGGSISYTWEQMDLGNATSSASQINSDNGNGPLFRSKTGTTDGIRYFPEYNTVLTGSQVFGETLPSTSRVLNFKSTARSAPYGMSTDDMTVTVTAGSGAFEVLEPQLNSYHTELGPMTVLWNTGGSENAPTNCSAVNILLASDGGATPASFTQTLASATANDGTELVTLPAGVGNSNRLWVQCDGGIFYNVNNGNFSTVAAGSTFFSISLASSPVSEGTGTDGVFVFTVTRSGGLSQENTINFAVEQHGTQSAETSDFAPGTTGALTFATGETEKTINITVFGDVLHEPDESFKVTLSNPSGGAYLSTLSAYAEIKNDDPVPGETRTRKSSSGSLNLAGVLSLLLFLIRRRVVKMPKPLLFFPLALCISACSQLSDSDALTNEIKEQSDSKEAEHPAISTLRKYSSANAQDDVKQAIENKDFKFFASAPRGSVKYLGLNDKASKLAEEYGYKVPDGMGDFIINDEHSELRKKFKSYASDYNQALAEHLGF